MVWQKKGYYVIIILYYLISFYSSLFCQYFNGIVTIRHKIADVEVKKTFKEYHERSKYPSSESPALIHP